MYTHRPSLDDDEDAKVANRQTTSLLGIAIILVLLIFSLFLVQQLGALAERQDCILAGSHNCEAVVAQHS